MRWILATAVTLAPSFAAAHVTLTSPSPRTVDQKKAPCGATGSVRGTNVTTVAPGSTITVTWNETIDHPGHYRVAFDDDGQDFTRPPTPNDTTMGTDPTVLIDLIADIQGALPAGGRVYTQQITLPNIECENCTLQLIQVMTDASKAPYTTDDNSNDIYFQCVDLRLSNSAPPPPMPDAGVPTGDAGDDPGGNGDLNGGGCSTGAGAGLLGAFALVGLRRRRKR